MTFEEILDQAIALLQRRGRLTYRALKRQFDLDEDYLEDLKTELIQGQRLEVDEDGAVLVWTGGTEMYIARLSEAYLLVGQIAKASTLAGQALALARDRKERRSQAWALRLYGEIASQSDPLELSRPRPMISQALALPEELGMRPLQAHCHHGLGTLYRQTGVRRWRR